MPVQFDEAVAESFIGLVRGTADVLWGQAGPRRMAAERATYEFTGAYARLYERACSAEAEDRGRLAGVLSDLADQVARVLESAQRENARERAQVGWEARTEARRRDIPPDQLARVNFIGSVGVVAFDPRPSDIPEVPPTVRAAFSPRYRERQSSGSGSPRSSALPERLEEFVARARPLNLALDRELSPLWESWVRLTVSSPWMRVETATFLAGFQAYLSENQADVEWVSRVAAAFRDVGGRPLLVATLNRHALVRQRSRSDRELLDALATLPEEELAALFVGGPGLRAQLTQIDPTVVSQWWAGLHAAGAGAATAYSVQQEMLLQKFPELLGNLDGIPAAARVRAHRQRAAALLNATRAEIGQLERDGSADSANRLAFLREEADYLRRVRRGDVQLYLYDRDDSRIIEMIGAPGSETQRAVTYVPGTFTGLPSFYRGDVQQVGRYLAQGSPGTVVFIYKDGLFPGEEQAGQSPKLLRIREANDPEVARLAGEQLRRFSEGARADPLLEGLTQVGIGHSWGLASLGAAENAGVRYDTVVSLSGAGLPPGWSAQPSTGYFDLSYTDLLQQAQQQGYVWRGNTPRRRPEFVNMPIYRGPNDEVLTGPALRGIGKKFGALVDNHNLIATERPENKRVLDDLKELVTI